MRSLQGVLTFVAAFLTMAFLMNFLKRASMLVFVLYRVAMGAACSFTLLLNWRAWGSIAGELAPPKPVDSMRLRFVNNTYRTGPLSWRLLVLIILGA